MSSFFYFFHPHNLQSLGYFFSSLCLIFFLISFIYALKNHRRNIIIINTVIFLFLLVPIVFYYEKINYPLIQKRTLEKSKQTTFTHSDPDLGRRPTPGRWLDQVILNDETLYQKYYTINEKGFRVIAPKHAAKALIFYGCSQTFGQGVDDNENFPALIQNEFPEYKSINLAISGAGTAHVLRLIEKQEEKYFLKKEKVTHAFYGFMPSHLKRNDFSLSWVQPSPWYSFKQDQTLLNKGIFIPSQHLTFELFIKHWHSYFLQRFFSTHADYTVGELNFFLKLLSQSYRHLKKNYPKIHFVLLYWPTEFFPIEFKNLIKLHIKKEGMGFIDFDDLPKNCPTNLFPCSYRDGHFTPEGHNQISIKLKNYLQMPPHTVLKF